MTVTNEILARAQAYVDRKYVSRADSRQKEMGLAYIEAERQDLAQEFARFAENEIAIHRTDVAKGRATSPIGEW